MYAHSVSVVLACSLLASDRIHVPFGAGWICTWLHPHRLKKSVTQITGVDAVAGVVRNRLLSTVLYVTGGVRSCTSLPVSSAEVATFHVCYVGCGRHLHRARAIRRWQTRCIREIVLIVALIPQFAEVDRPGVDLYPPRERYADIG